MDETFTFALPTEVMFGPNAITKTGPLATRLAAKKTLVVADPNVLQAGKAESVIQSLKEAGVRPEVFGGVVPNPDPQVVAEGAAFCQGGGFDSVVGVGGGSAIDTGKAICIMATNPGSILDYEGANKYGHEPLPLIAIPTTAGTGSEVTAWSVITDHEKRRKVSIGGAAVSPRMAICDPLLTISMPPGVTAATGMDALTHAIESYTNTNVHPICDVLAEKAIQLIGHHLLPAVANGANLQARSGMLLASLLAGAAFNNGGLGAVHCLTNPICSRFEVAHGLANAIMLPHVIEFNLIANPDRFGEIARLLGENVDGLCPHEAAVKAGEAVRRMVLQSGLPTSLESVGVKEEAFPNMAEAAMRIGAMSVNPRVPTLQGLLGLYRQAYHSLAD